MDFTKIRLFLFDMDGTLYLGDELFPFTKPLLETIRKAGKTYLFMTNNSSKSVLDYVAKMERLGIPAAYDDFITSSQATADYLMKNHPGVKFYVCGTESFKAELACAGVRVCDVYSEDIGGVVMGYDTELTYRKLDDVSKLLTLFDIPYIAANPDFVCPTEYGYVPDCGSVCGMIYNATGKNPHYIGKPRPEMPLAAGGTDSEKGSGGKPRHGACRRRPAIYGYRVRHRRRHPFFACAERGIDAFRCGKKRCEAGIYYARLRRAARKNTMMSGAFLPEEVYLWQDRRESHLQRKMQARITRSFPSHVSPTGKSKRRDFC